MSENVGVPIMTVRPWSVNNDFIRVVSLLNDNSEGQQSSEECVQSCSAEEFNGRNSRKESKKAVLLSCCEENDPVKNVYIGLYKVSEGDEEQPDTHLFKIPSYNV